LAERILLFIPMYNCAPQIPRVIAQITDEIRPLLAEVLVVNNRSTDDGQAVAEAALEGLKGLPSRLVVNDANYGLGGSHKVAFDYALANDFDYLIVLHGDDQARLSDIVPHLQAGKHRDVDALLGARFMKDSKLIGYSAMRTLGNHVFNAFYSLVTMRTIHDLGSGLNLYRVKALADRWWLTNADDLTFNYHMILRSVAADWRLRFFPLSWREEDQVSNVKLVRQAARVASLPIAYTLGRSGYLKADYSSGAGRYTSQTVAQFDARP
jgi:dolichol-phosphate mannosyltransferase